MNTPFPDTVSIPQGLVQQRLPMGLPVWAWSALLVSIGLPLVLFGRWGLVVVPVSLGVGVVIAYEAARDPQFLKAWVSELPLKRLYR